MRMNFFCNKLQVPNSNMQIEIVLHEKFVVVIHSLSRMHGRYIDKGTEFLSCISASAGTEMF